MKIRSSQFFFLIALLAIATAFLLGCSGGGGDTTNNNYYGTPSPTPSPTSTATTTMTFFVRNAYNDYEPIKAQIYSGANLIGATNSTENLTVAVTIGTHDFRIVPEDTTNWQEKSASGIEIKASDSAMTFSIMPILQSGTTPVRFNITNRTTGSVVEGADIKVYVGGVLVKTGTTLANGVAFVNNIPSGAIKIVISKTGYGIYTVDGVVISGGEPVQATYKLIPQ